MLEFPPTEKESIKCRFESLVVDQNFSNVFLIISDQLYLCYQILHLSILFPVSDLMQVWAAEIWQDMAGFGKIWQDSAGFDKLW